MPSDMDSETVRNQRRVPEIYNFQNEPKNQKLSALNSTLAIRKISTEPEGTQAGGSKTGNCESNPPNDPINISNTNPLLHFPNACRRLNLSDVERNSNPISACAHRSVPNPCKQHYYFGHRIRPRLRPFGRVSEGHQRG